MYNKRGISAIIATVMIILITVAAVGIVWVAIIPMIQDSLDFSSLSGRVSVLNKGYTAYDSVKEIAMVQVKRDVDEGVMDRIKITFDVQGNSHSSSVVAPASGNTKVYYFDMNGIGEPDSVSVAPIFAVGNREKEGDATSDVELPSSGISSSGIVYEIGRDYIYEMPMTGLVSWWKFDGDATDSVGSNDLVEASGGVNFNSVDERSGIDLSGVDNSYVYYSPGQDLSPDGESYSYSLWVYPRSFSSISRGDYIRFIQQSNYCSAWSTTDSCVWVVGGIHSDGRIVFGGRGYGDASSFSIGTPVDIVSLEEWKHIAYVLDRAESMMYIYVDGELIVSKSSVVNGVLNMNSQYQIGASWGEMDGMIDDAMIYNRALSENEVKSIYEFQKNE